jgi:ABC-type glutathione transport system ATPase component
MTSAQELLKIENLSIGYRTSRGVQPAVRDATLLVRQGEFAALVGESGCGKTTLVRGLLGLLRSNGVVTGGKISHCGEILPAHRVSEKLGSHIGFVPQNPMTALNPVRQVRRQMEEVFRLKLDVPRKKARVRCFELLERVRLGDPERVFASYPHQLSGGMAQRVVLAMALALGPSLFIADEPTSAVDAVLRKGLLEMIGELRKEGMGVLFVTHDLHLVGRYADSIAVMKDGTIVEKGPADTILHRPSHPYTRLLLSHRSRV